VRGYSVIDKGKQIIGMAIAVERNLNRFWANGGRVPYHIESDGHFENDQQFQEFRTQWEATYSQAHKAPILEDGLKLVTDGLSMHDSQANEFRQFMIPEVCRLFSVSPHLVADLSRATFSNIEHLTLEFVKMTLSQWLSRWEQSFRRCVLTPAERQAGYYLHFNVNALLRGDFKTRMDGYSIALQNGFKNIDEVRELEDDNALPNGAGETHRVQLNMQTVPGTGEPSIMEQGILARQTPAEPKSTEALVKAVVDAAGVDTTHDIMVLQHELAETLDGMKGINGPVDIHALERMIDGIPAELEYKAKRRKS
jgi:hypothetical protein